MTEKFDHEFVPLNDTDDFCCDGSDGYCDQPRSAHRPAEKLDRAPCEACEAIAVRRYEGRGKWSSEHRARIEADMIRASCPHRPDCGERFEYDGQQWLCDLPPAHAGAHYASGDPHVPATQPDPLHPDGKCSCAGEGSCEWCLRHCLYCGVRIEVPQCAACAAQPEQGEPSVRAPSPEMGLPARASAPSALADRLEALALAASDQPWHFCDDARTSYCDDEYGKTTAHTADHDAPHVKNAEANAQFIVALVNALPELLAALRKEPRP